jgi:hypothetical protein
MPSDDRRPVGTVFSKREAILLAAAALTVVAALTVLLSRLLTLDDAYITFRYARHLAQGYGLGAWNRTGEHVESGLALLRGAGPDEIIGTRRRKMILEMVSSPRFQREYLFVRNAPYDRMDRAAFLRRDFWEAHPRRDTLDCVPVAETALAAFAGR